MQKLILPINSCKLTASIKTASYLLKFGFIHYGVDMVSTTSQRSVYASGEGRVVGCGADSVVGNVVAVCYTNVENPFTQSAQDVIIRYFHLAKIQVKEGEKVSKDTVLGIYGNTGKYKMSPHLHIELDTDTAFPLHSPTVTRSDFIKGRRQGANDSTIENPCRWLHKKKTPPDNQSYITAMDQFVLQEDYQVSQL